MEILVDREGTVVKLETSSTVFAPSVASTTLVFAIRNHDISEKTVFDVGCGTGFVGLAMLARGASFLYGSDISLEGVDLARRNARFNGYEHRARFYQGDLFRPIAGDQVPSSAIDVVVSNPPLMPLALDRGSYGPQEATDGGRNGDECAAKVLEMAASKLAADGIVYLPAFSFSNPEVLRTRAESLYQDVEVVRKHDVVFDHKKLSSMSVFSRIYTEGHGYAVEHDGYPYWRIEILRCQYPRIEASGLQSSQLGGDE